tara:strand:+ start:511 stop:987 length:477 start_codon:yes stop_codon:yes gene_type:complete
MRSIYSSKSYQLRDSMYTKRIKSEDSVHQKLIDVFGNNIDIEGAYNELESHHQEFIQQFLFIKDDLLNSFYNTENDWYQVTEDAKNLIESYLNENDLNHRGISVGIDTWIIMREKIFKGISNVPTSKKVTWCRCTENEMPCNIACWVMVICTMIIMSM